MARIEINITLDLSQPEMKRRLMAQVGALSGLYEVKIAPRRETRSTRANAYYWAAVVKPFFDFLSEQDECITDPEQAHIELKRQILGTRAIKCGNGVLVRAVPTTRDKTVNEFFDYVERARVWLRSQVGIETLDPGEYGVSPPAQKRTAESQKHKWWSEDEAAGIPLPRI